MNNQSYSKSIGERTLRQQAQDLSALHFAAQDFDFNDGRFEPALEEVDSYLSREDFDGLIGEMNGSKLEEWRLALALGLCQRADEENQRAREFIERAVKSKDQNSIGLVVCALEILEERMGDSYDEHFQRILDTESERDARKLYRQLQISHDRWLGENGGSMHTTTKREIFRKVWQSLFG